METLRQIEVDLAPKQGPSSIGAGPAQGGPYAGRVPVSLRSAIRLLTEASRALWSNQDVADQCLAKAAALLQAASDVREIDARATPGARRSALSPWQVKRVVRFVDNHLAEKIAVPSLAAITRLSSSHFARAFRATVGEPPHAYVVRRRIERAQEQILSTGKPLAEIALDCGFGDQAHMTRLFRRVTGVNPGMWRRAHGGTVRSGSARDRATAVDPTEQHFALSGVPAVVIGGAAMPTVQRGTPP